MARDGAGVVNLHALHLDILDFLAVRKENTDEKYRIKTLSLCVVMPDIVMKKIEAGEKLFLFSPYDVKRETGLDFSYVNFDEMYDELAANPNIRKREIEARLLDTEISNLQNESGYPYVMFVSTVNRDNPVHGWIKMTNLCTEILQPQKPSVIDEGQRYIEMGIDINCVLSSINIEKAMSSKGDLGVHLSRAFRALNSTSELADRLDVAPTIKRGNRLYRAVGMGAMNLHGFLAKNHIYYGSAEALEFTDIFFMLMNYWTLSESNKLAAEREDTFHEFEKSEYANGRYFDKYMNKVANLYDGLRSNVIEFKHDKVRELFKGIFIPSLEEWDALQASIEKDGLYNSYRLAVAPTGSISYINESTSSIHPITSLIEKRTEGKRGEMFIPAPFLSDDTIPYYTMAYDLDQRLIIDTYATAQKHVDQALSMTLFTRSEFADDMYEWKQGTAYPNKKTSLDLSMLRLYAWKRGIKTIYYIRTFTDDGSESVSINECVNCSV